MTLHNCLISNITEVWIMHRSGPKRRAGRKDGECLVGADTWSPAQVHCLSVCSLYKMAHIYNADSRVRRDVGNNQGKTSSLES